MALSGREKAIAAVSNALTIYSIRRSENSIPPHATPHKFVLDCVPDSLRPEISAELIDDVYTALSNGS